MKISQEIINVIHPTLQTDSLYWEKWRDVLKGGSEFVDKYLITFSNNERPEDFVLRKKISYCAAFAKAAFNDVKNSIYQRIRNVIRVGGTPQYQNAVNGLEGGVDLQGKDMDTFIGTHILPEMLAMKYVGVYVDMPELSEMPTLLETYNLRPYMYFYTVENIKSWQRDPRCLDRFQSLLLEDTYYKKDEATGLTLETESRYRLCRIIDGRLHVTFFNSSGIEESTKIVNVPEIPFALFEVSESLLMDISDYQIALTNLASSDMAYMHRANVPFYTEQRSDMEMMNSLRPAGEDSTEAENAKTRNIKVGAMQGRFYPKGHDRPEFIHPSPEPVKASMEKQQQLKEDIRALINLSLSNIKARSASAESKQVDNQGLEAGLSQIGLELQHGEQLIARYFDMYLESKPAQVIYPARYSLRSEKDCREEAEKIIELLPKIVSVKAQKKLLLNAIDLLVGDKVSYDEWEEIVEDVMEREVVVCEDVIEQIEAGVLSKRYASEKIFGYPKGQSEEADEEHQQRIDRIAISQTKGLGAARGVDDLSTNPKEGSEERKESRNTDLKDSTKDPVRGEGD